MKKIFIFYFLFIFILFSCNKDGVYYELNEKSIEYFAYGIEGSWWIFVDSLHETKDSFYITEYNDTRQYFGTDKNGDSYQYIRFKLNSNSKVSQAQLAVGITNDTSYDSFDYKSTYPGVLTNYFTNFPVITNYFDSFSVENCSTCGKELVPNLRINNQDFENLLKIWMESDTFYFAPKIGLVQFYENGNTYLIKNYFINK